MRLGSFRAVSADKSGWCQYLGITQL